jgi:LuxR family transcriptional regulator, maltose regulon positive regulatory protein
VHEVLARAALAMGDLSRAMIAADELRTSADAIGTGPLRAAALHVAGQVAAQQGDAEHARALLEDAVDAFHRAGAPYETARARIDLGQVLLGLGDSGGCEAEWQAALTAFQTIGAAGDAARVMHQMGRSFGPVSTVSASRGTPSTALSEREVEILRLMARGLSNQEIADVLVISVRTVERHVSNIYLRIGVSGKTARASAVAHAYRLDLIVGR